MAEQENQEKCISERLWDTLQHLSTDQVRFVVARQQCATDKEAAESIGIKPATVYRWPDVVGDAVLLMAQDGVVVAQHVLRKNAAKAAMVKAGGLDSDDERIRQGAATEIIDRTLGKALQPFDVTTQGEQVGSTADDIANAVAIVKRASGTDKGGGAS